MLGELEQFSMGLSPDQEVATSLQLLEMRLPICRVALTGCFRLAARSGSGISFSGVDSSNF